MLHRSRTTCRAAAAYALIAQQCGKAACDAGRAPQLCWASAWKPLVRIGAGNVVLELGPFMHCGMEDIESGLPVCKFTWGSWRGRHLFR